MPTTTTAPHASTEAPAATPAPRFALPVSLDLAGRRALVLGEGPLADEKAELLRGAGADVVVRGTFAPGDLEGITLVVVSGESAAVDVTVVRAEARERGVLMNALDDVPNCDFAFSSLVRRGDVRIAISTGGRAPALARALRLRLEDELPPAVGELAAAIGRIKDDTPREIPFGEWAARWARALADLDHLLALIESGDADRAEAHIRSEIAP